MSYELSKACQILATSCCVCGRPLVDADSVDLGIGPICRKRYMKPEPGTENTVEAFRLLALSGAPAHVVEAVAARNTAREQANVLVYWISANIDNIEIAVSMLPVLRALGYNDLADILEKARVRVRIIETPNGLEIFSPFHAGFVNAVRAIPGRKAVYTPGPRGKFKCWAVPANGKRALWETLQTFYAGLFAVGPKGPFRIAGDSKPVAPVISFEEA